MVPALAALGLRVRGGDRLPVALDRAADQRAGRPDLRRGPPVDAQRLRLLEPPGRLVPRRVAGRLPVRPHRQLRHRLVHRHRARRDGGAGQPAGEGERHRAAAAPSRPEAMRARSDPPALDPGRWPSPLGWRWRACSRSTRSPAFMVTLVDQLWTCFWNPDRTRAAGALALDRALVPPGAARPARCSTWPAARAGTCAGSPSGAIRSPASTVRR